MSQASKTSCLLLAALLALAVLGVTLDTFEAADQGPISALRTQEPTEQDDGGSVDAFCGFAPCGMPLECN